LSVLSKDAVGPSGAASELLVRIVGGAFPSRFDFVLSQLQEIAHAPLKPNLVGTVLALWASMGVFGAITSAVNHAWGVEHTPSYFKHKLISFTMLVAASVLLLVGLLLVTALNLIEARWFAVVALHSPQLAILHHFAVQWASTIVFIAVVGLIFYFVPNAKVRFRDV